MGHKRPLKDRMDGRFDAFSIKKRKLHVSAYLGVKTGDFHAFMLLDADLLDDKVRHDIKRVARGW